MSSCHRRHGVAGRQAGRGLAQDLDRRLAVVALQARRAVSSSAPWRRPRTAPSRPARCARTTCADPPASCGGGVGLQVDLLDPAAVDEVVDVGAAPGGRQRVVDVGHRDARARRPWRGRCRARYSACRPGRSGAPRPGACPAPPARGTGCAPRPARRGRGRRGPAAGGRSRWSCRARSPPAARRRRPSPRGSARTRAMAARRRRPSRAIARALALVPVLELDEAEAHVLARAAEAEAGDGEDRPRPRPSRSPGSAARPSSAPRAVRSCVAPAGSTDLDQHDRPGPRPAGRRSACARTARASTATIAT